MGAESHRPLLQIADYLTKPQQLMAAHNTESPFLQQFYAGQIRCTVT